MEHQNNKEKNGAPTAAAEGGASRSGGRRSHHRGGRGRGGHKGGASQETRAKAIENTAEGAAQVADRGAASANSKGDNAQRNGRQGDENAGQGGKKNRNRRRGDHRGGQDGRTRQEAAPAPERSAPSAPITTGYATSSSLARSISSDGLDDIFSPLHEVEVNDPAAEETARRILDAEGALLFGQTDAASDGQATASGETVEIVGIRFKTPGKMYFFAPGRHKLSRGSYAIVETARGEEFGEVCRANVRIPASEVTQPLRPVLREATEEDIRHNGHNKRREEEAFRVCQGKIVEHGLDMKLVEAQYTFDNSKLLFYFTSDGRVDFRELVKDLAGVFRTRIELRQIGIRDEAKLLGGLGTCGRPLCCSGFLPDFVQVSIKMAKEQNLSLNSTKISGCCGRLMCCLRYEFDTYETEIRLTPSVGSAVETPDGRGDVVANHPLKGTVTVRLAEHADEPPRIYHRDFVRVLKKDRPSSHKQEAEIEGEDEALQTEE